MSFKNNVQFIILIKAKIIFYLKKYMPEIVLNILSTSKLYIITLILFYILNNIIVFKDIIYKAV